jgi:hypothetical protein
MLSGSGAERWVSSAPANHARQVLMDSPPHHRIQPRFASFGRENQVVVETGEGRRHGCASRVVRTMDCAMPTIEPAIRGLDGRFKFIRRGPTPTGGGERLVGPGDAISQSSIPAWAFTRPAVCEISGFISTPWRGDDSTYPSTKDRVGRNNRLESPEIFRNPNFS